MGRDRIRPGTPEYQQLQAVKALRDARERDRQRRLDQLSAGLLHALQLGGVQAHAHWRAHRQELVHGERLARDVIITPLIWVPEPPPALDPPAPPPMPTFLDALMVASAALLERPRMTREQHVDAGVYHARIGLLLREGGWTDE